MLGAALGAGFGAAPAHAAGRVEGPFGRGAAQVWLVLPPGRVRGVVVFVHGWKSRPPASADEWVSQFRPWLTHLTDEGQAVVFPRYEPGHGYVTSPSLVESLRRGLVAGFRRLGELDVPVVACGYSFGGSLVFYLAANAARWGLPVPRAIDSVFPAATIRGAALRRIPADVHVLLEVGDRDHVAGSYGADLFWRLLGRWRHERRTYRRVLSGAGLSAVHSAPKLSSEAARRAFWLPLDGLIASARQSAGGA
ncbi:MAG: hypothetical protein ACXVZW_02450 [Gaiellaceae bacterium]